MSAPVLEAMLANDRITAAHLLGCHIPPDLSFERIPAARRLLQLRADPNVQPWLLRAMIDRASGTMVGNIGFHAPPPMEHLAEVAPDGAELGYGIHQPYRRQKYATEAILALTHWAYAQHNQRCFVLTISPENLPSTALAESLGFTRCGSQMDEEDGLEIIFVRRFDNWPADWPVDADR